MKLVKLKHSVLIENLFSPDTLAGFSNNNLAGNLPEDISTALSFRSQKFDLAYLKQIHSPKVIYPAKEGIYEADGLFTKEKNLALIVRTADCLPLFFESKNLSLIGLVHMGWLGAKAGILDNLPCSLETFKVVAGVALRECCYQVGQEFLAYPSFKDFIKPRDSKLYFDPVGFAKSKLVSLGLDESNFYDLGLCSFCNQAYFSYRRDKTEKRILSFMLKV